MSKILCSLYWQNENITKDISYLIGMKTTFITELPYFLNFMYQISRNITSLMDSFLEQVTYIKHLPEKYTFN